MLTYISIKIKNAKEIRPSLKSPTTDSFKVPHLFTLLQITNTPITSEGSSLLKNIIQLRIKTDHYYRKSYFS